MKTAKLSVLPIKDLNPAEYNHRKKLKPGDKEYEKIKHSIEEFGFADPVVVNSDMTIIGGHQRVTVAAALGYTEVPCAIGFGISTPKQAEKMSQISDGAIVGSAIIKLIETYGKDAPKYVGEYVKSMSYCSHKSEIDKKICQACL